MHKSTIYMLVLALLMLASALMTADAARFSRSGENGLSVYGAYDKVSEKTGFGLALTKRDRVGLTDLSGVAFDNSIMVQTSQLRPIMLGPLPIYVGMTAAYAFDRNKDETADTPSGFMSGVQVVLAKAQAAPGLSLDLRASSLSEGFNPVKWISDPDALWFGAGASYSF